MVPDNRSYSSYSLYNIHEEIEIVKKKIICLLALVIALFNINSAMAQWVSPSDWLYVNYNNDTVETGYGNFKFYDDGKVELTKEGKHYDTVDWYFISNGNKVNYQVSKQVTCVEDECNITQILSFVDGSQFNISHNFDLFRDKMSFDISANERDIQILMHHHISGFDKYYNGTEVKTIQISELKDIRALNISRLKGFQKEMSFKWGKAFNYVDSVKFNSTDLLFRTKNIHFTVGQRVHIDPEWTTPSSVVSVSGGTDYNNAIDDSTGTQWTESTSRYVHWIIFDMGANYSMNNTRIYTDGDAEEYPCEVDGYFCNDSACLDSVSVFSNCDMGTSVGWHECSLTERENRYIKLLVPVYYLGCGANEGLQGFFEFDAYISSTSYKRNTSDSLSFSDNGLRDWNYGRTASDSLTFTDDYWKYVTVEEAGGGGAAGGVPSGEITTTETTIPAEEEIVELPFIGELTPEKMTYISLGVIVIGGGYVVYKESKGYRTRRKKKHEWF